MTTESEVRCREDAVERAPVRQPAPGPEGLGPLHERRNTGRNQAERRLRPRARRRARTRRPFLVAMRARKPWVRFRLRTLGWNVRFMSVVPPVHDGPGHPIRGPTLGPEKWSRDSSEPPGGSQRGTRAGRPSRQRRMSRGTMGARSSQRGKRRDRRSKCSARNSGFSSSGVARFASAVGNTARRSWSRAWRRRGPAPPGSPAPRRAAPAAAPRGRTPRAGPRGRRAGRCRAPCRHVDDLPAGIPPGTDLLEIAVVVEDLDADSRLALPGADEPEDPAAEECGVVATDDVDAGEHGAGTERAARDVQVAVVEPVFVLAHRGEVVVADQRVEPGCGDIEVAGQVRGPRGGLRSDIVAGLEGPVRATSSSAPGDRYGSKA